MNNTAWRTLTVGAVLFIFAALAAWLWWPRQVVTGPITVDGTIVCLPHKGNGPSTLECAYGLKTAEGIYYGLRNLPPDFMQTDKHAAVGGTLSPSAQRIYDIQGTIDIHSIK